MDTSHQSQIISPYRRHGPVVLLLLAAMLLLGQHWGMMFSNGDDPWVARASWDAILKTASEQGRFWLVPVNFLSGLPYKTGGWIAVSVMKMLVNGFALLAFSLFLAQLVNRQFALLTALVWLALLEVSHGHYSAFHGYPLMFNLQMGTLFLSLVWYLRQLDRGHQGLAFMGPAALFAFSLLAYEPMLFFLGAYYGVALYRTSLQTPGWLTQHGWLKRSQTLIRWSGQWLRTNWVLLLVVVAYIVTYFVYRSFQPTFGRGIDFAGEPAEIVKTIFRFSVHGFHVELAPLPYFKADALSPAQLLMSLGFGLCIAVAGWLTIPLAGETPREAALLHPVSLLIIAFFVVSPNILHGFLEMYRQWAAASPYYVGNYLSSFALAILVALAIGALIGGRKSTDERVLFVLVIYVLAGSAADNLRQWSQLAQANRQDALLWKRAIDDLQKRVVKQSAKVTQVCAKNSPQRVSGDDAFWSYHLSQVIGSPIEYRSKRLNSAPCDVTVDFNFYRNRS